MRFFPKRVQFDPPIELINSGEVWDLNEKSEALKALNETLTAIGKPLQRKWVKRCLNRGCEKSIFDKEYCVWGNRVESIYYGKQCPECKGKGYKPLSGPSFSCALLIFDRRGES